MVNEKIIKLIPKNCDEHDDALFPRRLLPTKRAARMSRNQLFPLLSVLALITDSSEAEEEEGNPFSTTITEW